AAARPLPASRWRVGRAGGAANSPRPCVPPARRGPRSPRSRRSDGSRSSHLRSRLPNLQLVPGAPLSSELLASERITPAPPRRHPAIRCPRLDGRAAVKGPASRRARMPDSRVRRESAPSAVNGALAVEERDGQTVELLVGRLRYDLVDDFNIWIAPQPTSDRIAHRLPIARHRGGKDLNAREMRHSCLRHRRPSPTPAEQRRGKSPRGAADLARSLRSGPCRGCISPPTGEIENLRPQGSPVSSKVYGNIVHAPEAACKRFGGDRADLRQAPGRACRRSFARAQAVARERNSAMAW